MGLRLLRVNVRVTQNCLDAKKMEHHQSGKTYFEIPDNQRFLSGNPCSVKFSCSLLKTMYTADIFFSDLKTIIVEITYCWVIFVQYV